MIIPCHHEYPIRRSISGGTSEYIRRNLEDAAALKRGELRGEKHPYLPCRSYKGKRTAFYYDK